MATESSSSIDQGTSGGSVKPGVDSVLPGRSTFRTATGIQFLGTAGYVPSQSVSNFDLGKLGFDAEWIIQRTGIHTRHHAPPGVATSDLAWEAAELCLKNANVKKEEVDLIVVATMTPDSPIPSTACQLQARFGSAAPAMDVNAACSGFMYATVTAAQFVKAGGSNMALVIGADVNSRIVDPRDKKTYPLFGDGAGALLMAPGSAQQGLLSYTLGADGSGADLLRVPAGGSRIPLTAQNVDLGQQFIKMDGRAVFKWAVRFLGETISDALTHAKLSIDDLDLVVLHQANARIIEAAAESLGLDRSKLIINLDECGNTSAASIPLCLAKAEEAGRVSTGARVLISGFGAGLSWGTAILQW